METFPHLRKPRGNRRVVITGVGLDIPLGRDLPQLQMALKEGKSASRLMDDWAKPDYALGTRIGSPVIGFSGSSDDLWIERKIRRSMSRVSLLAVSATRKAFEDSRLPTELIQCDQTGIAFASSFGGTSTIEDYVKAYAKRPILTEGLTAMTYLKIMPHTCAANIAMALGIHGRLIASGVACASSTQSLGLAYEWIRWGMIDRVVAGGADELTPTVAAIFDVLGVTSKGFHDTPTKTPRPFDRDRDGIVVGEGAGAMILEDLDLALAREAPIYGEIVGFYTNNDAEHMTNPSVKNLVLCMRGALTDAAIEPHHIDYINAHAAGTTIGDQAEAEALAEVFSCHRVAISSLKGHLGHLFGAGGITELAGSLAALQSSTLYPTLNLDHPLRTEPSLDWVIGAPRRKEVRYMLKNSFAFGGVNTSLIIKRYL